MKYFIYIKRERDIAIGGGDSYLSLDNPVGYKRVGYTNRLLNATFFDSLREILKCAEFDIFSHTIGRITEKELFEKRLRGEAYIKGNA